MSKLWCCVVVLALAAIAGAGPASLAGQWRFELDPSDVGVREQWFNRDLAARVRLPGSLQEQGFGQEPSAETPWTTRIGAKLLSRPKYAEFLKPGSFKCPFWLTPERHYVGPAFYQRDITIPDDWAGRRVLLTLERPHWFTICWLDGQEVGSQESLGTPHVYVLPAKPGTHRLTVRVDNRVHVPVGLDAHSVSDQTQSNWNGIVGRIDLSATDKVFLDDIQIYPNVAARSVRVVATVGNAAGASGSGTLVVGDSPPHPVRWNEQGGAAELTYTLPADARPWDEFDPALHRLTVTLKSDDGKYADTRTVTFGLREVSARGTRLLLNGRPLFLRGTLECSIFPLTGYPPTDVDSWRKILATCRSFGLNHVRFHSWCPPEAAFAVADEMGFYFQVEASCWARFGDGTPVDAWVDREARRMFRAYGNHPSFILMAPSNEPSGGNRDAFLGSLIRSWSEHDARRLYTAGAGWPHIPANQFHVENQTRIHQSGELTRPPQTAADYRDYVSKQAVPVIVHEMGQWCAYPDVLDEPARYTGSLKPGNLEVFREFMNRAGLLGAASDFLAASGKFQTLLYKEEIEANVRTPGISGFQLLDLHDFPGQGTAPVGVLNAFWEPKGYVTGEQYRRFCSPTVPLARLDRRTFTNDQTLHADIDVAHFGPADLRDAHVTWALREPNASRTLRTGRLSATLPAGALTRVGSLDLPLSDVPAAAKLNLEVSIDGTAFANDWDLWVYPRDVNPEVPAGVAVTRDPDEAVRLLAEGRRVFLNLPSSRIAGDTHASFSPIFWNRITFPTQKEHTLGILCDPAHPAIASFPTDAHSNWQWWDVQQHGRPMVLDALPKPVTPVIAMIDDWDQCRRLALAFEARVGDGRLLVCSVDLDSDLDRRLATRQLRRSLLDYVASDRFAPGTEVTAAQLRTVFRDPSPAERLGARVFRSDSEQPGHPASNVLDGDPGTLWHTAFGPSAPTLPHELVIEFPAPASLAGVRLVPRQDRNPNGTIRRYAVYASDDPQQWGRPVLEGVLPAGTAAQDLRFPRPLKFRYLRLVALSGHTDGPWTSLAELEPLTSD